MARLPFAHAVRFQLEECHNGDGSPLTPAQIQRLLRASDTQIDELYQAATDAAEKARWDMVCFRRMHLSGTVRTVR
jgi:hypothetical protein